MILTNILNSYAMHIVLRIVLNAMHIPDYSHRILREDLVFLQQKNNLGIY